MLNSVHQDQVLDLEALIGKAATGGAWSWPCDRLQGAKQIWAALIAGLNSLGRSGATQDDAISDAIELSGILWLRSIVTLAHAERLADHFRQSQTQVHTGPRYGHLEAALAGRRPPEEGYVRMLQEGPPKYPIWRWPFRIANRRISKASIQWRFLPLREGTDEITVLSVGGLIDRRAIVSDRAICLRDASTWFSGAPQSRAPAHNQFAEAVVGMARDVLREHDISLSATGSNWIRQQIEETIGIVQSHTRRLRRANLIPKTLWIGSGSDFWQRLLAKEVLRRGGQVSAHDHGFGNGWVKQTTALYTLKGFCDEFITYGTGQAAALAAMFENEGFSAAPAPSVRALTGESWVDHLAGAPAIKNDGPVMVLPLTAVAERTTMVPQPDDVTCCDFNYRLVAWLKDQGLEIVLKPHPAFDMNQTRRLASELDVQILEGQFEDVAKGMSLIIFCHPLSTTFSWSLKHRLPMVLLDFEFADWTPWGRGMLERNVISVAGSQDAQGRLNFDPQQLLNALCAVSRRPV